MTANNASDHEIKTSETLMQLLQQGPEGIYDAVSYTHLTLPTIA